MRRALALAACAALSIACFPQGMCESNPSFVDYCGAGESGCQGHIIDATHWESGPVSGDWLTYGPEQTILFHFRDATTGAVLSGQVLDYQVFVGSTEQPDNGGNFIPCSGNLCEITDNNDGSSVFVKNDTCASYFIRVVLTINPTPTTDAGTE